MPVVKWQNEFYIRVYMGAREGLSNQEIARQLGVASITFKKWVRRDSAIRDALSQGRSPNTQKGGESLVDYVYKRLPDDLKRAWDRINRWRTEENGQKRMDAYLEKKGKNVRQSLFLHAYASSNFNASEACRKVGISKSTLDLWTAEPNFQDLMSQMVWHKENFVEGQLFKLVKKADTSAVLFASKTLNAHRGYADKKTTEVNVTGQVAHGVLDLNSLKLPMELRTRIMEHVRKMQADEQKKLDEQTNEPRVALPIHVEEIVQDEDDE